MYMEPYVLMNLIKYSIYSLRSLLKNFMQQNVEAMMMESNYFTIVVHIKHCIHGFFGCCLLANEIQLPAKYLKVP